jgi:Ca-activated chloride channel homolog
MDFIKFENQQYFYLFALIPLFLVVFLYSLYQGKKRLGKLGHWKVMQRMIPMRSIRRPWLKLSIFLMAFSALVMTAVNPQIGFRTENRKSQGVDIIVALDVSRSMLAEDIRPNRLERASMAVSRLIDQLDGDRIGIILFAGSSVTQVPLTNDKEAAKMILRTVSTESVQVQGTAIAGAIDRAISAFSSENANSRVLIIISDGENHQDDPLSAVERAREQGIIIHTIGVGTQQGAPIPVYQGRQLAGFLRDQQGATVISRYDEKMLMSIAQQGAGVFNTGSGPDLGLNQIISQIREMEQQEFERTHFSEYESRYHYFLAIAILLLLLDVLILERKNRWLNKIKLFDVSK